MEYYLLSLILLSLGVGTEGIDCSTFNKDTCQQDSIRYCLTDGRIIDGTCEVSSLVCESVAVVDETFAACVSSLASMFNCTGHIVGGACLPDSIPYCLTNGETVLGTCDAKAKVCEDGEEVDITGASCADAFDCNFFNPDEICRPDMVPYCLKNGEIINGICETKKAICGEGEELDSTGDSCKDNGASTMTLSVLLVFAISFYGLFEM
ncbi:hypothetical protein SNE40_019064 [Patella caerulea]|uniref:Uncharacterized protein n=1 Tax=Patella caerulea TaxID=87958 RepID=A0AAN8J7Y5_PATCE